MLSLVNCVSKRLLSMPFCSWLLGTSSLGINKHHNLTFCH